MAKVRRLAISISFIDLCKGNLQKGSFYKKVQRYGEMTCTNIWITTGASLIRHL
jgi:hypothetical protein